MTLTSKITLCPFVLVLSDCYCKILWTEWLVKSKHFFLTILEARKSKIKALADSVSDEGSLPGS